MRRALDIVVAVVLTLLTAPIVAVIALLIVLTMGRPVLFRQERAGLGGHTFTLVKFRTMVNDAVGVARRMNFADPLAVVANDPRVPALGRFLRSSSLDELPQLFNILRGDMTLIGPRPTTPDQVVHYTQRQRGRLSVRPGLTGWAQVNGRNAIGWPERIELDLYYIANRSLVLDTRIVLQTALRLVRPSGVTGSGGVNPAFPVPAPEQQTATEGNR